MGLYGIVNLGLKPEAIVTRLLRSQSQIGRRGGGRYSMRPFNATQDVNTCNSANRLFSDSLRSSDVMRAGDGRKEEAGASGQCVSGLEPWKELRGYLRRKR